MMHLSDAGVSTGSAHSPPTLHEYGRWPTRDIGMQAQPCIASRFSWLSLVVIIVTLTLSSVFILAIITDDQGDSSCGGG